jgi:hypothetical protein
MKTLILALTAAASLASAAPALADPFDHGGGYSDWRGGDRGARWDGGYRDDRRWRGDDWRWREERRREMRMRWFQNHSRWQHHRDERGGDGYGDYGFRR